MFYFALICFGIPSILLALFIYNCFRDSTVSNAFAILSAVALTVGVASSGWFIHELQDHPEQAWPFVTFGWSGVIIGGTISYFISVLRLYKVKDRVEHEKVEVENRKREYELLIRNITK